MLRITIPAFEGWDERNQEFISIKECTLQLEHSLVSLSKWESKWHKSFISSKDITEEESIDYVRCMTITQNVPDIVYSYISDDDMKKIMDYINDSKTATTFSDDKQNKPTRDIITSEQIYGWMVSLQIPSEYQKWHLNRLLTLIRVCNINNTPPKKMGRAATMNRNRSLNAARRQRLNTKG